MIKETLGSTGLICCSMNVRNLNRDLVSQVASDCLLSLKKDYKALISQTSLIRSTRDGVINYC